MDRRIVASTTHFLVLQTLHVKRNELFTVHVLLAINMCRLAVRSLNRTPSFERFRVFTNTHFRDMPYRDALRKGQIVSGKADRYYNSGEDRHSSELQ